MAMDPVSRRLAAAAMGLAFGLSRDEELEKTRLDLERARMEREDFRYGKGPDTQMIQHSQVGLRKEHFARIYANALNPSNETVNQRLRNEFRWFDKVRTDLIHAKILMSKVLSEIRETRDVSHQTRYAITEFLYFPDDADSSDDADIGGNADIGDHADIGDNADINMVEESEEEDDRRVRRRTQNSE